MALRWVKIRIMSGRRERIREEKLRQFALTKRDDGGLIMIENRSDTSKHENTYLSSIMTITLHLKALAQIHEALVDLTRFGQSCPCCSCVPRAFRTCVGFSVSIPS